MKTKLALILVILIGIAIFSQGCTSMFTAKTTVHYERRPDGTIIADYTSDKDQVGLSAIIGDASIKVDRSDTNAAAIGAALETNRMSLQLLQDALKAGAAAAKVAPIP